MQLSHYSFFVLLNLIGICYGQAQSVIKGTIKDDKGEALSFASVWVKGTQQGTTSNEQGLYELKLEQGTHEVIYQYIGYNQQSVSIHVDSEEVKTLHISLKPSTYQLNEVRINATAEDPAYPIMRQVIARRAIYLNEAKEFQCRVYMKALQRLTAIPKRVLLIKIPETVKPGIVYLSESLSELNFQQPDKYKERMLSSKVSGNNRAFSFNQASALQFTLYDNLLPSYGLNERGFVSPLASNALFYYKYKLIGESLEDGLTVYKIQLIPIRKSDPVFKGFIYIIKDSWRLFGSDLMLDKSSNIEFVDTLYIKQSYARQPGGTWMQVSQRLIFEFEIMGFRGNGYFVSVFSNYKVNSLYPSAFYAKEKGAIAENLPTPQVRKVEKIKPKKLLQQLRKANGQKTEPDSSLFDKKYFNCEVLTIDKQANKTDDSIWSAMRPIQLSEEEVSDYLKKDSIQTIRDSRSYKDSMDRINNKPDWSDFLLTGYSFSRSYKKQFFTIDPLLAVFQYNTVEGLVINPGMSFTRTLEDRRNYLIAPAYRYGFASKQHYGKLRLRYKYDAYKESSIELEGGLFIEQYNSTQPISPELNAYYTLMQERNYMKLYQKGYIRPEFTSELVNGISLNSSLEFSHRVSLENASSFAFKYFEHAFTSNIPVNSEMVNTYFNPHHALILDVRFHFVFAQEYASRPNRKINYGSVYPRLNIQYKKGIPLFNSKVNFDAVNISLNHELDFKLLGMTEYHFKTGAFMNSKSVFFPDFSHFNGNLLVISPVNPDAFQLLDYYVFSTTHAFVESHISHHFNGFWLNKIPLIRKLKWQEVVSLNYLKTATSSHYFEWGVGIEHMFKFLRVDYYQAFQNGTFHAQGLRFGFGF
ncbi:MAG: DUF5686 and carboxypeptidase regulatory-like domain-containing protein [Bacteroidia bacterium]|jgi:hypothetical protein